MSTNELMKYIHPRRYYHNLHDWFFYYLIPDEWEIRYRFKKKVGYSCDLKNPRSFNEKIQWIKLHDRNPFYPQLTDKIEVKKFVARELGEEYVIPTLAGGFSRFDDIPFDTLPEQFVLKSNHDSHNIIVCDDRCYFDYDFAKAKMERALARNYYHFWGKQWGYKDIKPQLFIEKYMEDGSHGLVDYKFHYFNGECKCILYCSGRSGGDVRFNFYDTDWKLLPVTRGGDNTDYDVPKPENLDQMLLISKKLASLINNAFVRVDLYDINGKIYFGEYTFYPGGGIIPFQPREWDYKMGEWLVLPNK